MLLHSAGIAAAPGNEKPAHHYSSEVRWWMMWQGFTSEEHQGKEEVGSNWLVRAESGCRAAVAVAGSTSRSLRCTEEGDLRREKNKQEQLSQRVGEERRQ